MRVGSGVAGGAARWVGTGVPTLPPGRAPAGVGGTVGRGVAFSTTRGFGVAVACTDAGAAGAGARAGGGAAGTTRGAAGFSAITGALNGVGVDGASDGVGVLGAEVGVGDAVGSSTASAGST
ncbi:MAG TPA: hypothetical protein VFG86_17810, partial [Chloroflexota bacterium]|nr:hypothetical protein [Chloroflexota bacterium]